MMVWWLSLALKQHIGCHERINLLATTRKINTTSILFVVELFKQVDSTRFHEYPASCLYFQLFLKCWTLNWTCTALNYRTKVTKFKYFRLSSAPQHHWPDRTAVKVQVHIRDKIKRIPFLPNDENAKSGDRSFEKMWFMKKNPFI